MEVPSMISLISKIMGVKKDVLIICAVVVAMVAAGVQGVKLLSGLCSDESIPEGSTYWNSLNATLADLVQNTPTAANMTYSTNKGVEGDVPAYGQAQCLRNATTNVLPSQDSCRGCIEDIIAKAWLDCVDAIAVDVKLNDDCTLRYQDSPLLPDVIQGERDLP
ncbi:hypothetical protein SELMODRAFT_426330 [Selaginella moellendorffii]|uniref:Gnk2-homologous domain-containing protein n=1 Tax=Selaginella moellendorffii TaxID=88036 RepID=D8SW18_SELML|nr:antifungal protein ginkbilobin-2 [Selaginella moellendorffii]EFJ11346.1 hypothetical protein SELMODRAFT_426330 [Selaginella moellendorffii]|eukprot:XP_002987510.1 antifungal protein ginkbilobin-2 [Selaginella moellendorffii]